MNNKHRFKGLRGRIANYFFLALLPIILILIFAYGRLLNSERSLQMNRLSLALEASVQSVDTSINASERACMSLSHDRRVKRYLKPIAECNAEDRIAQIEIHEMINSMISITDAVTETMLIYVDNQYIFADGLYSFTDYFRKLYEFENYDTAFWQSLLSQRSGLRMLPVTAMTQKNVATTQNVVPMVYATKLSGRSAIIVATLSVSKIVTAIQKGCAYPDALLLILDANNHPVYGDFSPSLVQCTDAGALKDITLNGDSYSLIEQKAVATGWQYYLALPHTAIYSISEDFLTCLLVAIIMCVAAGVLTIYFSDKISSPMQQIYSSIGDQKDGLPRSLQDVSQKFNYFMSNYQDIQEEDRFLRAGFVEMALLRLLSGHASHLQDLSRQLEQEYAFTDPIYQLAVLEIEFNENNGSLRDTERINMQMNFRGDLTAYLSRLMPCLVLENHPNQYICLVNHDAQDSILYDALSRLSAQIQESQTIRLCHACVSHGTELKKIGREYERIMNCLSNVQQEQPFSLTWAEETTAKSLIAFTLKDEMQLLSALRSGDQKKTMELIDAILEQSGQLGREQVNLRIHDLFVTGMRFLAERDTVPLDNGAYHGLRADVELPGGLQDKRELLERFYRELMGAQSIGSKSNLTEIIVSYVQEHYASDLYLDKIAQDMGLSVKYISKVFKTKTGRNLSDYINEVRLRHIKDMLQNTDMSIASIGEAAGIYSRTTLIRLFRKYEGITPSEYRDLFRERK